MATDEDIKLELGGEVEPGASAGWRPATSTPRFTEDELAKGLPKDAKEEIEKLFELIASLAAEVALESDLQPDPEAPEPEPSEPSASSSP
jgi:hypothetical protein